MTLLEAVRSGSALFAQTYQSQYLLLLLFYYHGKDLGSRAGSLKVSRGSCIPQPVSSSNESLLFTQSFNVNAIKVKVTDRILYIY